MRLKSQTALFWILVGVVLIFLSLILEASFFGLDGTVSAEHRSSAAQIGLNALHSLIKLLDVVGIACLVLGLIHTMIEAEDWSDYFRQRIREIVMDHSYLRTLDKASLSTFHASVLKAQFGDQQIDREGSFFNYLRSNLHDYIAKPYREEVTTEVIYSDSGEYWDTFDRVTYVCRKAASGIQSTVTWQTDPGEVQVMESLTIEVQFPYTHSERGKRETIYDGKPKLEEIIEGSLSKYQQIDNLIVITTGRYKVRKDMFQYWDMLIPTKNFTITMTFPDDYEVKVKPMVLSPELILTTLADGYYKAKYDFWMLPGSGMTWMIVPKEPRTKLEPKAAASGTNDAPVA